MGNSIIDAHRQLSECTDSEVERCMNSPQYFWLHYGEQAPSELKQIMASAYCNGIKKNMKLGLQVRRPSSW